MLGRALERRFRVATAATLTTVAAALVLALVPVADPGARAPRIQVAPDEAARRVDVTIDGKPFTSYIYPHSIAKPVLWPIRAASGVPVTRGYPLEPRKGERVDHPHQIGLWFNHGDVNGFDFWGNSDAIKGERRAKLGSILHRKIANASGGAEQGELSVEADWVAADGVTLLREETRFVFRGNGTSRSIERITMLTALDKPVIFGDTKEGVLGLRVARSLEHPEEKATPVPVRDNASLTGRYLSSEGTNGEAVWGTRARWMSLGGTVDSQPVTIAILDHPSNPGFPTHWHARGYGLFAANMLGLKAFSNGKEEFNLTVKPRDSVTFRYKVVILNGAAAPAAIEAEYKSFTSPS